MTSLNSGTSSNTTETVNVDSKPDCVPVSQTSQLKLVDLYQEFSTEKPMDKNPDTFWGNEVIRIILKNNGVFYDHSAGYFATNPRINIQAFFITDARDTFKCFMPQRFRDIFERDVSNIKCQETAVTEHRCQYKFEQVRKTQITIQTSKQNGKLISETKIQNVKWCLPIQITYFNRDTLNDDSYFLTTLDLLELHRDGLYLSGYAPPSIKRLPCPLGLCLSDWYSNEYSFLKMEDCIESNFLDQSQRQQFTIDRFNEWRTLLLNQMYNKKRVWTKTTRQKMLSKDSKWTCAICQDTKCEYENLYAMQLPCSHAFHQCCFADIVPASHANISHYKILCPICRRPYFITQL